jgi:uncharacterized protein YndB with AHSA1/START domain
MSILKRLLIALLLLVAVVIVGGFVLPASTHVERSISIARPPAEVFAMLNSYRRFNEWSPWHGRDPKTVYTYEGPTEGVGAGMRWSSEQSDVGKGRQTIIESVPNEKVGTRLEFEGQNDAIATFALTAEGDGTRVVWSFDTEHGKNPISRWFGLMLDRWVGGDFAQGLAKLKTLLESGVPESGASDNGNG